MKCPGQDTRHWKPEDVFDIPCPGCGVRVEFFKDDVWRECGGCGQMLKNPHRDIGCAEWCPSGDQCLGGDAKPDGE